MLEQRLLELSKHIVEFSALVEGMLSRSITGLQTRDRSILETVTGPDEDKANQIEIEIDEAVTVTIAQFQPKAKELRTALMILKMNNDLERMADHAVNIAESAFYLIQRPPVKPLLDIPRLAEIASRMLKESMLSFVNQDVN
ncbi:MAG: phosphate transport system regulatory protein PhoU, partial [Candidatus Omnitrophica bacterium]|nr:phosphate transport system regulatory protein PhoU [Candidatus Omnitrophota bacterium]